MNFKERVNPKTDIEVIPSRIPRVGITSDALVKMFVYVEQCSDEIGWLGTVQECEDNAFLIDDVFLFEQDVHATTTEITPEGLSSFGEEILSKPNGIELWNTMRMWGHSHVNMGVSPSSQDDKQMKEFSKIGHDWFIRLIANKKGEMCLDFYNYKEGIIYSNVPWVEVASQEEEELANQIKVLQEELNKMKASRTDVYKEPIKEEMKTKVKKKSYGAGYGGYVYNSNAYKTTTNTPTKQPSKQNDVKKNTNFKEDAKGEESDYNYFTNDDEVTDLFARWELVALAEVKTLEELEEELQYCGYISMFSEDDIERIYKVALKYNKGLYTEEEYFYGYNS